MGETDKSVAVWGLLMAAVTSIALLVHTIYCRSEYKQVVQTVSEFGTCLESGASECHIERDTDGSLGVYSHE